MARKRKILIDFDGVIHGYESGWKGVAVCTDPPVPGVAAAIRKIRESHEAYVFSTRCCGDTPEESAEGIAAIEHYLKLHGIEVDGVVDKKIPASLSIDDRGYRFNGDWAEVLEFLESPDAFNPWNKKGR